MRLPVLLLTALGTLRGGAALEAQPGDAAWEADDGIPLPYGFAFLPPRADAPGAAAGGRLGAGLGYSAAVVEIVPGEPPRSLPALGHARTGAQIFRLGDGSLIVAGGKDPSDTQPPAEWLSAGAASWAELELPTGATFGQVDGGTLVAIHHDGRAERLVIGRNGAGEPLAARTNLPPLRHWRVTAPDTPAYAPPLVRAFANGRIVVAGGVGPTNVVAILDAAAMNGAAPDRFIGLNGYSPFKTYRLLEPAANEWRESTPARSRAGGWHAAFADGRVVKRNYDPEYLSEGTRWILEISAADGSTWRHWNAAALDTIPARFDWVNSRLFVAEDELFLSGDLEREENDGVILDPSNAIFWYDAATERWRMLWQAATEKLGTGRVVTRTLPNGERVTVPFGDQL